MGVSAWVSGALHEPKEQTFVLPNCQRSREQVLAEQTAVTVCVQAVGHAATGHSKGWKQSQLGRGLGKCLDGTSPPAPLWLQGG